MSKTKTKLVNFLKGGAKLGKEYRSMKMTSTFSSFMVLVVLLYATESTHDRFVLFDQILVHFYHPSITLKTSLQKGKTM